MNANGAFVVVTYSRITSLTWGVFARRFSAGGGAIGLPIRVDAQASDAPLCTRAGMSADGGFAVTWQAATGSTTGPILVRSYGPTGVAVDSPTQVPTVGMRSPAACCQRA